MADTYSTQLFMLPGVFGGPYTAYTVPPGKIAVAKCFTITWGDINISGLDAYVQKSDGTKLARVTYYISFTDPQFDYGGTQLFWGMFVFNPGEIIQVSSPVGTCDFHGSGYLLASP